ncbi:MAG: amino acid ABC transporter permease [Betaproteobacteria bacterium]|nr:amino acid ABC transporter permease [Betaproteobacteria bacterium]
MAGTATSIGSIPRRPAPRARSGALNWVHLRFFNGAHNVVFTLAIAWALVLVVPDVLRWAVLDAVWTGPGSACRTAAGACWAIVAEKYRLILFGTYPYEEHWRATIAMAIIIALAIVSAFERFWSYALFAAWVAVLGVAMTLMFGGVFGLASVGTHQWGGLPLTLLIFIGTVVGGLPLAVLLALGRRSELPVVKALCVGVIEITRGVPLITVLFMASLMLPLFMPEGVTIDKLLRAQLGMIIFFAAYAAEIVRGGLQAIPFGQTEAANAIGLNYWQRTRRIILPQALRIVIPPLMNDIIRAFKNTTFVSIVGLFDVLGATSAAIQDPEWVLFAPEAYLFIFALYFVFCFTMSKYSESVERKLAAGRNF